MSIAQLNFENKTKVEVSIDRLRMFEPPEGYYLAFSGGKDSIVVYDLAVKAGVKFDAHYHVTGIDPPELVRFIRKHYPGVEFTRNDKTIWELMIPNGYPTRIFRWCCRELKENGGTGRFVLTGVRWAESVRRKNRNMTEICANKSKRYLHPIIDFKNTEIWEYIANNNIAYCSLYDDGFDRLGCIMCPQTSYEHAKKEMERWPGFAKLWRKSFNELYKYKQAHNLVDAQKFNSGEEMFQWWLKRDIDKQQPSQCFMFE